MENAVGVKSDFLKTVFGAQSNYLASAGSCKVVKI